MIGTVPEIHVILAHQIRQHPIFVLRPVRPKAVQPLQQGHQGSAETVAHHRQIVHPRKEVSRRQVKS